MSSVRPARPRPTGGGAWPLVVLLVMGCGRPHPAPDPVTPPAAAARHDLVESVTLTRADGLVDPLDVAVDPAGRLLVLDGAGPDLLRFDVGGAFVDRVPVSGTADVAFFRPQRVSTSGLSILLLDPAQRVVVRTDLRGKAQGIALDLNAAGQTIGFFEPRDFVVDGAGQMFLADAEGHRVLVFSQTSRFLLSFGEFGSGLGQLKSPQRLMVDDAGVVYVVERGNRRVQRFDGFGAPLGVLPLALSGPGRLPVAMADYRGRLLVIADESGRVNVYPRTALSRERAPLALLSHTVPGVRDVAVHPDGRIFVLAIDPIRIVGLDVEVE